MTAVKWRELQQAMLAREQQFIQHGVVSLDALQRAVRVVKALGEKLVFTNGCFDLLHAGHVRYLHQARQLGDRLIVAVNTDQSITRIKGKNRPILPLAERMDLLAQLRMVDWVVSFDELTPHNVLHALQPDVLVKGGDYTAIDQVEGCDIVQAYGGTVEILDLVPHRSTTQIINKIHGFPQIL